MATQMHTDQQDSVSDQDGFIALFEEAGRFEMGSLFILETASYFYIFPTSPVHF